MARQATAPDALERTSASLEGRTSCGRASVSLKDPTTLEQVSASLEAPGTCDLLLPTKALNVPSRHECRSQRQDPRHNKSLTLLGKPVPTLCGQNRCCAAIPGTVRYGRRHSAALCHPLPSFFHAAPLEGVRRHPQGAYDCRPGDRPGWCRDAG
jgi:hypothetical protein